MKDNNKFHHKRRERSNEVAYGTGECRYTNCLASAMHNNAHCVSMYTCMSKMIQFLKTQPEVIYIFRLQQDKFVEHEFRSIFLLLIIIHYKYEK